MGPGTSRRYRACAFVLLSAVALAGSARDPCAGTSVTGRLPAYTEAPVLYHFFHEQFGDTLNLELVHQGRLKIGTYDLLDIEDFDWLDMRGRDNSMWILLENFWYLTPLMASPRAEDAAFVRRWLEGWLDTHPDYAWNNYGARDAMSAGFRAMTFVWYLRAMHERGDEDLAFAARVRYSLRDHQKYLTNHYAPVSNHGFWEAIGLFETNRVFPDSALVQLALDRLDEMVAKAVSDVGFYMERAPGYQLLVTRWLQGYVDYFRSLDGFTWGGMPALEAANARLQRTTYYLSDHRGTVPQIGDSDSRILPVASPDGQPEAILDTRAGYAIFKGAEPRDGRYVVFTVPIREHAKTLQLHDHDDALAVYYALDGVVVVGDAGRYTYTRNSWRKHMRSAAAHSTIIPAGQRVEPLGVSPAAMVEDETGVRFEAAFDGGTARRVVHVPRNEESIDIVDSINQPGAFTVQWLTGVDIAAVDRVDSARGPSADRVFVFDLVSRAGRRYRLTMTTDTGPPPDLEPVDVISGSTVPRLGWFSPANEVAVAQPVIRLNLDVVETARVATRIERLPE